MCCSQACGWLSTENKCAEMLGVLSFCWVLSSPHTLKNTFQSTLVQLNKNWINDHRLISHQCEGLTQEMFGKALMKYC